MRFRMNRAERTKAMSKLVFAAVLMAAFYSAYRMLARAAERQREAVVRANARASVEPRDLGRLRETEAGVYVPEDER